jgi:putative transposase
MDATVKARAEQLAQEIATQASTVDDLNGMLRQIMKSALERLLHSELEHHLKTPPVPVAAGRAADAKPIPNRRNGTSKKTVQGDLGEITLDTPRDRDATVEPKLVPKHQRRLAGFDDKILALDAKGMTTRDLQDVVPQLDGVEVSPTLISEITADLDSEVTTWRTRSLEAVWPIAYFDGIVVHVRGANGRVSQHTVYVALGVNLHGRKELLGLWLAETEGAKFGLACRTDLKSRGLKDLFVACIDGLSGFAEAIHVAYPEAKVQLCLVHLGRAALRYVTDSDSRLVVADLKQIYQAKTLLEAEQALENFASAWDAKYPTISKMWRPKWSDIITLFDFPEPIRRAIYTTNAIESVNSVIRKFTRNRKIDPSAESALKGVFVAIREAAKKGTMPIPHGKQALNHFAILFEGRLPLMRS